MNVESKVRISLERLNVDDGRMERVFTGGEAHRKLVEMIHDGRLPHSDEVCSCLKLVDDAVHALFERMGVLKDEKRALQDEIAALKEEVMRWKGRRASKMGADLDVCVEMQHPNCRWSTVAVCRMVYRGPHSELLRDVGHEISTRDLGGDTSDVLFDEEPYWVRWLDGLAFVGFADRTFGKIVPFAFETTLDTELSDLFDPGVGLRAIVEMVRSLVLSNTPTRIVYWYGQ